MNYLKISIVAFIITLSGFTHADCRPFDYGKSFNECLSNCQAASCETTYNGGETWCTNRCNVGFGTPVNCEYTPGKNITLIINYLTTGAEGRTLDGNLIFSCKIHQRYSVDCNVIDADQLKMGIGFSDSSITLQGRVCSAAKEGFEQLH